MSSQRKQEFNSKILRSELGPSAPGKIKDRIFLTPSEPSRGDRNTKIKTTDNQIDQLVQELYVLIERELREIQIMEGSLNMKDEYEELRSQQDISSLIPDKALHQLGPVSQ